MPKATLSRRAMPADMQAALAAYAGPVTHAKTGKRNVAPAIMCAAERGATSDTIRAARAGLITECTRERGK